MKVRKQSNALMKIRLDIMTGTCIMLQVTTFADDNSTEQQAHLLILGLPLRFLVSAFALTDVAASRTSDSCVSGLPIVKSCSANSFSFGSAPDLAPKTRPTVFEYAKTGMRKSKVWKMVGRGISSGYSRRKQQ